LGFLDFNASCATAIQLLEDITIRVYFVFHDPLDEDGVNLSFIDVPTTDPTTALRRLEESAHSGELWKTLYPDESDWPYELVSNKMSYLDISELPNEHNKETLLPL
jgi:hypothetical protein